MSNDVVLLCQKKNNITRSLCRITFALYVSEIICKCRLFGVA